MKRITLVAIVAMAVTVSHAQNRSGICIVSASEKGDGVSFVVHHNDCDGGDNCGSSDHSNMPWSRWAGVTPQALSQSGTQITAKLHAEAGDLQCAGTVNDGMLTGRYTFTGSQEFQNKLKAMGLEPVSPERRLEGYALLDVTTDYIKQMQAAGVTGLDTHRVLSLKALKVTPEYVKAMAAAGYPEHEANKLVSMKAVGVTPEKVKEAHEMGFTPTQKELTDMCVFHIDRAFVEKMKAQGLKDLTMAKLVKIKIFKLDQ